MTSVQPSVAELGERGGDPFDAARRPAPRGRSRGSRAPTIGPATRSRVGVVGADVHVAPDRDRLGGRGRGGAHASRYVVDELAAPRRVSLRVR